MVASNHGQAVQTCVPLSPAAMFGAGLAAVMLYGLDLEGNGALLESKQCISDRYLLELLEKRCVLLQFYCINFMLLCV